MATMDRKYAKLNTTLLRLREQVAEIQNQNFDRQAAASLQKYEYMIGALILFMVAGATSYGLRIARQIQTTPKRGSAIWKRCGKQRHARVVSWIPRPTASSPSTATPEAMRLRRSTVESVRHFEIPYLWSSAFSCTRSSRSASGDELGGHRLQLETDDEGSRSTQVGRRAGHGLNCFRKSAFTSKLSPSQKEKAMLKASEHRPCSRITGSFRNSLKRPPPLARHAPSSWLSTGCPEIRRLAG
jgi:hypothetical protein